MAYLDKNNIFYSDNRRLSIKLTQENWEKIHHKADHTKKNLTDYVTHTCLDKDIIIITDLAEVLKAVGKNLNQLAMLVHNGRITAVNFASVEAKMGAMNENMRGFLERRR